VLARGGRFVAITPNAGALGHRKFGRAWRGLEPPRHVQVFGATSLRRAAEAAGLKTLRLETGARMAAVIHAASRALAAGTPAVDAERAPNAADRAFQRDERRALRSDPFAGEELLLIAIREAA
jgi:hypothetical protein